MCVKYVSSIHQYFKACFEIAKVCFKYASRMLQFAFGMDVCFKLDTIRLPVCFNGLLDLVVQMLVELVVYWVV